MQKHSRFLNGFTLIEVLVVISIVVLITSVLIFSGSKGRAASDVQNAAQALALHIQEMQAYALGVRSSGGDYGGSYGLDFIHNISNSTDHQQYVAFVDVDQDRRYDTSGDILLETVTLPEKVQIDSLSLVGTGSGSSPLTPGSEQGLTIVFERPSPDAHISRVASGKDSWSGVAIVLESTLDSSITATITVLDTGHVRVE